MDTLTFVGMTGSLRRASRNKGLLRCCASHLPEGVRMEIADISALPFYNEDLEKPQAVKDLVVQVTAADALVLALSLIHILPIIFFLTTLSLHVHTSSIELVLLFTSPFE